MIQGLGKETTEIPAFGHDITEVRAMGKLAWQKSIPDYLCFEALEAGTFTLSVPAVVAAGNLAYIEWSKDGRTWNRTVNDSSAHQIDVSVEQGDKVYWRGSGVRLSSSSASSGRQAVFSSTGEFNVSGHILSLLKGSDYDNMTGVGNITFPRIFENCTKMVSAEELVLPTSISGLNYAFYYAFYNCKALVAAPQFPSDVAAYCYFGMYRSCISLTQAPALPAQTLVQNCYSQLFYACSSLNYIKCLATDISAADCLTNWVDGVASVGRFVKTANAAFPSGKSGIPTNWLIYEDGGARLPIQYKETQYTTNTTTANLNLGHEFNTRKGKLEVKFRAPVVNGMVLQTTMSKANKFWLYNYLNVGAGGKLAIYVNDADNVQRGLTTLYSPLDTDWHEVRYEGLNGSEKVYHNGTLKGTSTFDLVESGSGNLVLFGNTTHLVADCAYYREWDADDNLVCDLVPCVRVSDSVAGFFDLVSLTFMASNNGTTTFDAGPEI